MTGSPRVRPALPSDALEIVRLGELMYAAVDILADDEWRATAVRQVRERLTGEDLWGWVIDADAPDGGSGPGGRLAASGLVNRHPRLSPPGQLADARAYIQWVSTDEAYRRRGFARAIMERIIEDSAVRGFEVLDLHSSPFARGLYAELGFRESPAVDYPADVRGVPMQLRASAAARPAKH